MYEVHVDLSEKVDREEIPLGGYWSVRFPCGAPRQGQSRGRGRPRRPQRRRRRSRAQELLKGAGQPRGAEVVHCGLQHRTHRRLRLVGGVEEERRRVKRQETTSKKRTHARHDLTYGPHLLLKSL